MTGRAVVTYFNGLALENVEKLSATMLSHPKEICTVEEWYISTEMRRDYRKMNGRFHLCCRDIHLEIRLAE